MAEMAKESNVGKNLCACFKKKLAERDVAFFRELKGVLTGVCA
jgi:hypothetical protein